MKNKNNILMTSMMILILIISISGCADNESKDNPSAGTSDEDDTLNAESTGKTDVKTRLKNIFRNNYNLEYKATYVLKNTDFKDSTMSQYMRKDEIRTDMVVDGIESRSYVKGEKMYSCTKRVAEWTCMDLGIPYQTGGAEEASEKFVENMEAYNIKQLKKRTIAGTSTECYSMETYIEGAYFEHCFSSDNIPLYTKAIITNNSGTKITMEMTATSYSTSVSDADFELPAEPTDIRDMIELDNRWGSG